MLIQLHLQFVSPGPDYSGLGVPQQESSPLQYGYQPEQGVPGSPQPPSTNNYEDLRRRNREMSQVPNDGYRSSMPQVVNKNYTF